MSESEKLFNIINDEIEDKDEDYFDVNKQNSLHKKSKYSKKYFKKSFKRSFNKEMPYS
jgi:hypothetical protein